MREQEEDRQTNAEKKREILLETGQTRAELTIPGITVIGNQSAGKSSVVEAISGINVPRDAGTCTRCPMECRLSSSNGPWRCRVSIRWEYNKRGDRRDEVEETVFGDVITDKSQVELALRRAQAAVLFPDSPPKVFLSKSANDLKSLRTIGGHTSLQFSRNVVCVDLEGPELTDLSFIDLPGIIQNAEPDVVKLVEDLVIDHIKGNSLILVALPMTDDIENQKALRLARQVDPNGQRTIGVLTKPDMLTRGALKAQELWIDVIEGRHHNLLHGYYCTRQPDDSERAQKISSQGARKAEEAFFRNTPPWSISSELNRFGTASLVTTLSQLLTEIIENELPNFRSELAKCKTACLAELDSMPKAIEGEPATHLMSLVTTLATEISRFVEGGLRTERLIHENRAAYMILKRDIRKTAPCFLPYVKGDINPEEDPEEIEPFMKDVGDEDAGEEPVPVTEPFFLSDMRKHIEESITRELPDDVPFPCKAALIRSSQKTWQALANACFKIVYENMARLLRNKTENIFGRHAILSTQVKSYLKDLMDQHVQSCLEFVVSMLEMEEAGPFTSNNHYYDQTKEKWLAKYKDARAGRKVTGIPRSVVGSPAKRPKVASGPFGSSYGSPATADTSTEKSEKINEILGLLAEIGMPGRTSDDLGKLNPPDKYIRELNVMAQVRAYFQVSYKRVIDIVPMGIDFKFVKAIGKDLQSHLISKLELGTADASTRAASWLAEDPRVVERRNELTAKKKRLEGIEKELLGFGL